MKKSLRDNEIKVFKIDKDVYQIQKGRLGIVISAKSKAEALKKACKYLGIHCGKHSIQAV